MGRTYLELCNEVINLMSYLPVTSLEGLNTPEGRQKKQKIRAEKSSKKFENLLLKYSIIFGRIGKLYQVV